MDTKIENAYSTGSQPEPIDLEQEIFYATKLLYKKEYHYLCDTCGYVGTTKQQRYKHIKTHENNTTRFECSWCSKTFKQKSYLRKHSIKQHGFPEKIFNTVDVPDEKPKAKITFPAINNQTTTKTLMKTPKFRIVMGKTGTPALKFNKKRPSKSNVELPPTHILIPTPISPLPPTPKHSRPTTPTANFEEPSPSSSTETVCQDEYGMFSETNELIINIGQIYGVLNKA
jgi:hypothetical protein